MYQKLIFYPDFPHFILSQFSLLSNLSRYFPLFIFITISPFLFHQYFPPFYFITSFPPFHFTSSLSSFSILSYFMEISITFYITFEKPTFLKEAGY